MPHPDLREDSPAGPLHRATHPKAKKNDGNGLASSRGAIFAIQMIYLLALAVPAAMLVWWPRWIPATLGSIPTGVPWFGALGAVIVSLWGLTEHRNDWDGSWKYWHWSRPVVGATLAAITVLIFKAGILAVGATTPPPAEAGSAVPPATTTNLLYYVIAFVVGYREETFRDLMKKVADVILTPGATSTGPAVTALSPADGPVAGGTQVIIAGTGFTGAGAVWFGAKAAAYLVKSDTCIEATTPEVEAGGKVPVLVQVAGGRAAVGEFTYS